MAMYLYAGSTTVALRHCCRGARAHGCLGGVPVAFCPGGRATTADDYGKGTTAACCHRARWLGEAVRTIDDTRGGEHRRRHSTSARGVTISGAPGADPTMVPRILAWRKHHGRAGANVPQVWGAPRWRSTLEIAPRRRTRMLAAQRLCSATELAPRQRTGVRLAPRRRSTPEVAPLRRTRVLAAPRWCPATLLRRSNGIMAYLYVGCTTMAYAYGGGSALAPRYWTGATAA